MECAMTNNETALWMLISGLHPISGRTPQPNTEHPGSAFRGVRTAHNWGSSLPENINVGFTLVSQGYDGKEGYLKIQGLEGSMIKACVVFVYTKNCLFVDQISRDFIRDFQEFHQELRAMFER